jgi:hypothetical protein
MTDVDIAGAGIWSQEFGNWAEFQDALAGREVESGGVLKPELIPARERRRAPAAVKMAVEVMDQACRMANIDPTDVATVFGSGMGDMQITDYICRTLADAPRMVSPTKFHNSVHNASTGYWSIATGSHFAANAISAYSDTVAASLLEGAVQAVEEGLPVLVALEELAAPQPFKSVIEVDEPLATALLLTPQGYAATPLASLRLEVRPEEAGAAASFAVAGTEFDNNFTASLLPLLAALAHGESSTHALPLSRGSTLDLSLEFAAAARSAQA